MIARPVIRFLAASCLLARLAWAAEPIPLIRPEATFHAGSANDLACVIDGVETGPCGWSTYPQVTTPQSLVIRCSRPLVLLGSYEATELDFTLFFLSSRPLHAMAEFALSYTTDSEPSLAGN